VAGLEVPLWFAPSGVRDAFSWHRSTDFEHVGAEVRAVREGVGVMDASGFAKYAITGPGAGAWLDGLLACRLPAAGRMTMAPMLKEDGKLIGDFTLANLGAEGFLLIGSGAAEEYHLRCFEACLPHDGSVGFASRTQALAGLAIAGPRSRELLSRLTRADVGPQALRFMDIRHLPLGLASALVARVSYTGDLGYELWCEPAVQLHLFEALMDAGKDLGIRPFGARALNALRLEKGYGSWAREYRPIYGVVEAGLDRFVAWDKPAAFRGKAAAQAERASGGQRQLLSFIVETDRTDVIGDEPVWFEGRVCGWVTSGGFAHGSGVSVAMGYVERERVEKDGTWEIEILGQRFAARPLRVPLFDPDGRRLRG
jgi:dimethylglycine dehydrogenase